MILASHGQIEESNQASYPVTMEQFSPMTAKPGTSFALLGAKVRQRIRTDYQSSVNVDSPVQVDHLANPKWKRGQLCWEAKGRCAQDYKNKETALLKELNQSRRESFCEVAVSLFMIGKTPQNARPMIIISSEDKRSREEAKRAITRSGILRDLNFEIGFLKYLPSGPIHAVAGSPSEISRGCTSNSPVSQSIGWDSDSWEDMTSSPSNQPEVPVSSSAYYNPKQRLRITAMPIYVKTAAERSRMATANMVHNGKTYKYITVAHVFSPWNQNTPSIDSGEEDLGIPFDSDSEDEDQFNERASSACDLVSALPRSAVSQDPNTESAGTHESMTSIMPSKSSDMSSDSPSGLLQLGDLSAGRDFDKSKDYAIITINDSKLHQQLENTALSNRERMAQVSAVEPGSSQVTAWTSRGPIFGTLGNVPRLMRLSGSKSFQLMYEFAYKGAIENGDSGSLVSDEAGKELYGMIIAASDNQSVAYVMAAKELMLSIANAEGWYFLRPGNDFTTSDQSLETTKPGYFQISDLLQTSALQTSRPERDAEYQPQQQQQPQWNEQFQRYLCTLWNDQYQRNYYAHYVEGQGWVFFDWVPQQQNAPQPIQQSTHSQYQSPTQPQQQFDETRVDSAHYTQSAYLGNQTGYASSHQAGADSVTNRLGPEVHAPRNAGYSRVAEEQFHLDFKVRNRAFFTEGRMFSILFTEPAGANVVNKALKFGEYTYTQVRRFIVVRCKREYCFAVPVFTYGNRGTTKPGVVADEHAIAYSDGHDALLVEDEPPLTKSPIPIVMNEGEGALTKASRIYFGIHHVIQYNVKVKDIGHVRHDWLPTFLGYWSMESGTDSQQSLGVSRNPTNHDMT